MFPNKRRNQLESMYSTLSPNTLTADEQKLDMSPQAAEVVNFVRDRIPRAAQAARDEADLRASEELAWIGSGGLAPSGRVYRSPTGEATPETEAIIARGRQRIDPAGADMSHIMRASANAPSRAPNTDAPLPASQELLDKIRMERESKQRSLFGQSTGPATEQDALRPSQPFDAEAYATKVKSLATPQAWAQKARYDAAQAKQPEIRDNLTRQAMAEGVMRKARLTGQQVDPLTARLFVDANSGATGKGDGGRQFSGGMNAAYQALFPSAAKTAIAADAAAAQSADRNVLERSKADAARSVARAETIAKLGAAREAELRQQLAQAQTLEERARLEQAITANNHATLAAVGKAQGIDSGLLDGLMPQAGGVPAQTVSTGSTRATPVDLSTPSGRAVADQTRAPSAGEIARAYPFPNDEFAPGAEQAVPPPPGETGTERAVQFGKGQDAARRVMDPIMEDIKKMDPGPWGGEDRRFRLLARLKAKYPSIPEEQLKFAIASAAYGDVQAVDPEFWSPRQQSPIAPVPAAIW
jgi:hypothetical protein